MHDRWEAAFRATPDRYGEAPSEAARRAAKVFASLPASHRNLLDLGCGAGRDALFFAEAGMHVVALDFSESALENLRIKSQELVPARPVAVLQHDVRKALPFEDASFDACYSHMLLCMDFSMAEIHAIIREVRRVLKPGGIFVYTARSIDDPDFGLGIHHGEQLYEDEGFIVHFFHRRMLDELAVGFRLLDVTTFEEGSLPRRLFAVTMERAPARTQTHRYEVKMEWSGSNGVGTTSYTSYSRGHEFHAEGKPEILGSADPHFRGDAARWNPEELFVGALSACHQLWYLHLCAEAGVVVLAYADRAEGTLRLQADGEGEFVSVVLHPQVTIAAESDPARALALHHDAHEKCFLARSVKFPVACEPCIAVMAPD